MSTTQKSSQVAQAVFSSPSQSIKDRDLPHSLDFTDYLLSPSDIQLKDMSYYEQGPFSPEDLVVESTSYKRPRSPINESRVSKRICLSKPEDCQDPISVSDEFDSEEQSVLQMDEFSQMVQTAEVLDPSRQEWMSGPHLDSNEEFTQFMQKELFQIEANSDFQESVDGNEKEADEEIERRLSFLDTIGRGSHTETRRIEGIEKFDEQNIPLNDRFVLNAIYESRGLFGSISLTTKIKHKIPTITQGQIEGILKKYDLGTKEKRTGEHSAGWSRFNAMPLPIEPVLETVRLDSHTETPPIERVEKFDEQSIPLNDRFVLNAIYDSDGFLELKDLVRKTQDKAPKITSHQIEWILKKYDLGTQVKRIAEHDAGWPRFNAMPLPIEPGYEESIPLVNRTRNTNIDPKLESAILRLAYEKPDWSYPKITNGLKDQGFVISRSTVYRILMAKNLTTRKQRKEAADALSEQDQTISDSLDLPDPAFSPSSIFLEDFSEEQISNVLRPFDANEQSISQLDHFSQMADTWEALAPSREEWTGEPPLDSDEESIQFMQEELFQIEANSDLQEGVDGNEKEADEEELSILETVGMSSHMTTPQVKRIEKFDEQSIPLEDRFVLNALYESRGLFGACRLATKIKHKIPTIGRNPVIRILKKYDLGTAEKRTAEHSAGWPRFSAMPLPIEPSSEKSITLLFRRAKINNPILQEAVVKLAIKNPDWTREEIANELKDQGFVISISTVYRILMAKKLTTRQQRKKAARLHSHLNPESPTKKETKFGSK